MRILVFLIPILLLISSCKTKEKIIEVPVETIKKEYIHDIKVDSVFVKDSINRWRSGDTLYIYKEHTKYKYINKTDTIIKVDSIPKIIEIKTTEVQKVNYIKWYQEAFMWLGIVVSIFTIMYIMFKYKFK